MHASGTGPQWRRLAAHLVCFGVWKGVGHSTSPYRLKNQGFLTFCHLYGGHSFKCQFCARLYVFALENCNISTFLPFSLTWQVRWAWQQAREAELGTGKDIFAPVVSPLFTYAWTPRVDFFQFQPPRSEGRGGAVAQCSYYHIHCSS